MENEYVDCNVTCLLFSGWSLHSLRSEGASGAEREALSPPSHDPGYDDVDDGISGTSI